MAKNEILLTGRHGICYQLSVVSQNKLWTRNTLANNKCSRLFESKIIVIIKVTKRNISALNVSDRIGLLSNIARTACLSNLQHVILTTAERILFLEILALYPSAQHDSYYFVWRHCCRFDTMENVMEKMKILKINYQEIIGEIQSIIRFTSKLNQIVDIQWKRQRRSVNQSKTYHIISTLSPLKIVDTQIMNYNIPNTVFPLYSFPNGINVFVFVNKSRMVLKPGNTLWLKYTPSMRTIKFQPSIKDRGIHHLHICSNTLSSNETCVGIEVIVTSSSPQVHQIHIRERRNDYIINYTLPLVWFRTHKVIKNSQIQITGVKASIPISWGNHNSLLFLNISSIEGTVLDFMVDVIVNKDTFVQLELMMPLMSLAKSKPIIYQFRSKINWLKYPFNAPKILIFELNTILNMMSTRIMQLLSGNFRVSILPLQILGDHFDSPHIKRKDFIFDWTFFVDSDLPKLCLIKPESIMKSLENLSTKDSIDFNTSAIENKLISGCGQSKQVYLTTSFPITRRKSTLNLFKISTIRTDFQWKPILIPDSKLSVECGVIFQYSLPAAISGIQEMHIIPILFSGPKPDWIGFSNSNQTIVGVIAKTICPKREFHFMINGSNYRKQVTMNMKLIIEVTTTSFYQDLKFQIDLIIANIISFDLIQIIKTINEFKQHTQSDCQQEFGCTFNISLLRPPIKKDESIHLTFEILDNSTACPQTLGIFLRNQVIETYQQFGSPNLQLARVFYRNGIGQLTSVAFHLRGICQNKNIFPPNLGERIVFNNIPMLIPLKVFHEFYNSSVELGINNQSSNGAANENYSNWMKINNDSSILYILASTEHVRSQSYIVELSVYPGKMNQMLLPKIIFKVLNLMHHPSFIPYIRELNHQISIDITANIIVEDTMMPLDITLEIVETIDNYLRSNCVDISSYNCGTDILVFLNSVIETQEGSNINFKLSSIQILNDGNSTELSDSMSQKLKCPIKKLSRMEGKLKRAFYEYRQSLNNHSNNNKSWIIDSIKVLFMGPCVHTETAYVKINEDSPQIHKIVPKENKIYFENTQHMFLMATVIPAASFICITLILGITTACLLSRKNRKKHLFNSSTLKIQTDYPPVIFQSDTDTYSPPSKPLILQNEKPPQPLPDDEDDYDGILIPNVQSMKFYRPNM